MLLKSLFICSLTVTLVCGQRYSKSISLQPRIGYTSNIVHQYPGGSDQQAESSIKVDFHGMQSFGGQEKLLSSARGSFANEAANSNLFNVGYDMSFKKNNDYTAKKLKEHRYTNVDVGKFENAEVITGRIKQNEKVRAPSFGSDQSPQDFVSQAIAKQKLVSAGSTRHTSTSISNKGRYAVPVREQYSKYRSQSPTFTYNTQEHIFKDVIKATRPDPIQLSPELRTSYETSNQWNSRSPIVAANGNEAGAGFNHDFALKNSESFDFNNAHGEISFGDTKSASDSFPAGSEQHYNVRAPAAASDLNNLDIEAHIPKNLRGVKPLPLDTSLLKDPVLTTSSNKEAVPKYGRVIPIHFDIRPLKNAMQTELAQAQNYGNYNYQQPIAASSTASLTYENPGAANLRMHGNREPIPHNQFQGGLMYGKDGSRYGEDVYKIISMRPPPIGRNFSY